MKSNSNELGVEAFETNEAIMSLLEEFQEFEEDRNDDDRVNSLIQSLGAEISSSPMASDVSGSIEFELTVDDFQEGSGCSGSLGGDSEMGSWFDAEKVTCSTSDEMKWYVDSFEYEMEGLDGLGIWVGDYSHFCYEAALEDNGYRSIWQETVYDSIMYD